MSVFRGRGNRLSGREGRFSRAREESIGDRSPPNKHIDLDQYVRWSARLVDAGHSYLGVSGAVLAQAARVLRRGIYF
jgi:hypothetical protein